MKSFVALLAVVAVVAADVSHLAKNPEADAQIVEQAADVFPDSFRYIVKTSNGINAEASGQLQPGPDGPFISSQGSNSYTAPDGSIIEISFVADENGYQPKGAHLPTPPPPQPIPEHILRALEYIRTHPPQPEPSKRF